VILLDTSVLSRAFRRRSPGAEERRVRAVVEELLDGETALGLPGIVLQEVLTGIRSESQFAGLEERLVASFSIVSAGAADHVQAARLANRCQAAGLSASGPDCLIAVLAIAGSHQLFAMDDDFRAIAKQAPLKLFEPKGVRTAG
jgi:predicted nucleic acid-binding protein